MSKLSNSVNMAIINIYDSSFVDNNRVKILNDKAEYSFEILLYWNKLEVLLKILKYRDLLKKKKKDDDANFPTKLDFITRSWSVLRNVSTENKKYYEIIFVGEGKKKTGSLWSTRNKIVHANYSLKKKEYEEFKNVLLWLIKKLKAELPNSADETRKLLNKYKNKSR